MTDRSALISGYEAVLDWWRDAGIDHDYADDATTWLAGPETPIEDAAPVAPPPRKRQTTALDRALRPANGAPIGGDKANWPGDVAAFREWWLSEPTLDDSRTGERIVSRGPSEAQLMVLVGLPDEGDTDRLLAGQNGAVLSAFLRAAGVDESSVYIASALPRRVAMPDWGDLAGRGLKDVTGHHVTLVKAGRLLAFGRSLAPLIDETAATTMIAPSLENLSRSAARKRRFWNNWLEWTA